MKEKSASDYIEWKRKHLSKESEDQWIEEQDKKYKRRVLEQEQKNWLKERGTPKSLQYCLSFCYKLKFEDKRITGVALGKYDYVKKECCSGSPLIRLIFRHIKENYHEDREKELSNLAKIIGEIIQEKYLETFDFITFVPPKIDGTINTGIGCLSKYLKQENPDFQVKKILKVLREMKTQHDLGRAEKRRENVEGAYGVLDKEACGGKKIMLIDDVYRSGATVEEISNALLNSGAKSVFVLCLTRTGWGNC